MTQRDDMLENSDPKEFFEIWVNREYSGIESVEFSVQGKGQAMKTESKSRRLILFDIGKSSN